MTFGPEKRKKNWKYKDLGLRYNELWKAFEAQQEHIRELDEQAEELRHENQEQSDSLHELRNAHDNDAPHNFPDNDALDSILNRNQELQTEYEQLREDRDIQEATFQSEVHTLQERLNGLQAQLEAANKRIDRHVSQDEDTIPSPANRSASLRLNRDANLDETHASTEQRIQELEDDLERAIAEAEMHESKLQHCGAQRQKLDDRLRNKEDLVGRLKDQLSKERSAGECTKRCEDLEKKLFKLVQCIRTHGEAVNKVVESVMEGME
jgi:chromosome segregation ATPase